MAKTVTVLPRDDGQDFQNSWMVHVSGQMKSNHTTKQAARNKAREYANKGDTMEIRRTDGSVQERFTVRDGSAGDSAEEGHSGFAFPGFGSRDYGEGTVDASLPDMFK